MRYAILYDSHSGNTAHVAQTIRHTLPEAECLCFYSAKGSALGQILSCVVQNFLEIGVAFPEAGGAEQGEPASHPVPTDTSF